MSDAPHFITRRIECSKVEANLLELALRERQRLEADAQSAQAAAAALWNGTVKDVLEQHGEKAPPASARVRRLETGTVVIEIPVAPEAPAPVAASAAAPANGNGHAKPAKKKGRLPVEAT